ncbi:hypothetical protein NLI96_g793 [Meripilus lineatus]|uniref:Peptidase C14 caspase domain-containing protein n=1 Tax=Meripilus lineatus TaxID=2056292 RepID=A0AAD5VBN9_9APHY|nr:hypothetical protein NLI96_g793 [Physisporinus lineatus]
MPVPTIRRPTKKALIIAIRYMCFKGINDDLPLYTPHKDALAFHKLLTSEHFGYDRKNIRVLVDTTKKKDLDAFGLSPKDNFAPTRDNIIEAMEELVADAQPGDRFVLHFAGHGGQVHDLNNDESDGWDEVLYPSDIQNPFENQVNNYVLDDDIKRILVDRLPPRSRLVMIFDCCHSGTAGDLQYVGTGVDSCPPSPQTPPPPSTKRLGIAINKTSHPLFSIKHSHGDEEMEGRYVTSWSACRDNQVTFEDQRGSIFGNAFNRALTENPRQRHRQLLNSLRVQLVDITAEANKGLSDDDQPYEAPLPQIGSIRRLVNIPGTGLASVGMAVLRVIQNISGICFLLVMAPVVNRPHPIVKKALLIAVQYRCSNSGDSLTSLDTTPEDVYAFRKLLIRTCLHVAISCHSAHKLPGIGHFSYEEQNIQVLVDGVDSSSPYLKKLGLSEENNFAPTYDNIIQQMEELVANAKQWDHFVLYFSGHGDQVLDQNGDEEDCYDEVLYPSDIINPFMKDVSNYILDDDIKRILVDKLPPYSRLTMVFDCCHSGTAGDLKYTASYPLSPVSATSGTPSSRRLDQHNSIQHGFDDLQGRFVTSWSACRDSQNTFQGTKGSIFGKALTRALRENPHQTHRELHKSISERLAKSTEGWNAYLSKKDPNVQPQETPRPQVAASHQFPSATTYSSPVR